MDLFSGLFTGHDPTRGSVQEGFKISRVGSGHHVLKSHGSGRVGSRGFQNLAGRVGSKGFKISRVGSGHDPRDTGHFAGQAIMTRELFWADPRVTPRI